MTDADIDRAASEGYDAFTTGARMPGWIGTDELLIAAWYCGRRQASDKAKSLSEA